MLRAILSKLRTVSADGLRSYRFSIIVAFGIISIAVGGLAWRSFNLSRRAEIGANTLAVQYAGYAAEITARRVDASLRAELSRASEDWQQMERRMGDPTRAAVLEWLSDFDWIITAIYIPDFDPASSIYVSEVGTPKQASKAITREFFTSSGMVRYTYDAGRLLGRVHGAVKQQPLIRTAMPDSVEIEQRADVSVVKGAQPGARRAGHTFTFYSPLAPPMEAYSIKAVVSASYAGSGWENQRLISLGLSLLAVLLTAFGAYLAIHGLAKTAETMKLRAALIANVSHELRTPLSMIRLGAETLKRGKLKEKERADIEDQILREVLLLSHLVENVLDVARIQNRSTKALAFTPVLPKTLITGVLDTYASWIASKGFVAVLHVEDDIDEQMWDRDAVSRALLNLIDNAIKYSGDDKVIEIRLRRTETHVAVEVRDRGIGISSRDVQRIFDPYYRAQFSDTITRRGAGLGLTLVQQIVTSHGGTVEVESEPGQGSTFRLLFPNELGARPDAVAQLPEARQAY